MNFTSNKTNLTDCEERHDINSFHEFMRCYGYFARKSTFLLIIELGLIISSIILNSTVIFTIFKHNKSKSIYDKIIIGHSISNLTSGLAVMPFFHIEDMLDYWPFGMTSSILWAAIDNTINTVTNLHMLYMSYSRLRSIIAPKQYTDELILKKPFITIMCFWIFGLSVWMTSCFIFKTFEYTTHIDYHPHVLQPIINYLVWLLPLKTVLVISIYIFYLLKTRVQKKNSRKKGILKTLLDPESRFSFIIGSYILQWSVPAVYIIFEPYLGDYFEALTHSLKWPSYTVIFNFFKICFFFN